MTIFSKKKNAGYLIMELVVYCALLLFMFSICYSWLISTHMLLSGLSSSCNKNAAFHSGLALLYRDLYSAPHVYSAWKKCDEAEIIWPTNNGRDIGWRYTKTKLERREGTFLCDTHRWEKNVATSVITMEEKMSVQFEVVRTHNMKNTIVGTQIRCTRDGITHYFFVALRNKDFAVNAENK